MRKESLYHPFWSIGIKELNCLLNEDILFDVYVKHWCLNPTCE